MKPIQVIPGGDSNRSTKGKFAKKNQKVSCTSHVTLGWSFPSQASVVSQINTRGTKDAGFNGITQ